MAMDNWKYLAYNFTAEHPVFHWRGDNMAISDYFDWISLKTEGSVFKRM